MLLGRHLPQTVSASPTRKPEIASVVLVVAQIVAQVVAQVVAQIVAQN